MQTDVGIKRNIECPLMETEIDRVGSRKALMKIDKVFCLNQLSHCKSISIISIFSQFTSMLDSGVRF